jgi:NAD(P)-dependent dehydrogenase (short-subunit alcohol dehydrogenase family)
MLKDNPNSEAHVPVIEMSCCDDRLTENQINSPDDIIPVLAADKITHAELVTATRVLSAISKFHPKNKVESTSDNGNDAKVFKKRSRDESLKLYQDPALRPIRKAIAGVFELYKLQLYNGENEEDYFANRLAERTLKRQKMAERAQQKKYIADTQLRRGRIEKLERLKNESKEEEENRAKIHSLMIADGHVDTGDEKNLLSHLNGGDLNQNTQGEGVKLPKLRSCYVCKVRYRDLHHFYDKLCPPCAKLNFQKRHFKVDLSGKIAVVTGARVKIGYQVCLKLLRAGCQVVATTRFPNSAAASYKAEKDFDEWRSNLHIYGLDLRDVVGLEAFTRFLKVKFGDQGIDILINNACQTVRRPTAYYRPAIEREIQLWKDADESHKQLLRCCLEFENVRRKLLLDEQKCFPQSAGLQTTFTVSKEATSLSISMEAETNVANEELIKVGLNTDQAVTKADSVNAPFESTGLSHSTAMSQMVILPDDVGVPSSILPMGFTDINGQQIDLRKTNSWLLKLDQVSTPELMECMFINAIAPFVLNARLQPLMTTPEGDSRSDRYIINVSAMEGKFYRYKMPNHPHTNMAKAALNMLTRTSAEDLAKKHRIFMNSVDTGWINDENPLEKASKTAQTNFFQTPIDEIDAAARILDPVFVGVELDTRTSEGNIKVKEYGKFFKDYRETEW